MGKDRTKKDDEDLQLSNKISVGYCTFTSPLSFGMFSYLPFKIKEDKRSGEDHRDRLSVLCAVLWEKKGFGKTGSQDEIYMFSYCSPCFVIRTPF